MPLSASARLRWRRLAWFVLLWICGAAAIAGVAYLLRAIMKLMLT